jgi:hypothetical protein
MLMKNQSYPKILAFGFIYVLAFKEFSYLTADPDLWGHILFGKEIWDSASIPKTDSFSFTAFGERWINHEWLTEVLFYLIYANLGSGGLLTFKMILGWTIIYLLSQSGSYRETPYPFAITSIIIVPVMSPGFMVRPQLMTFLFSAILIFTLKIFIEKNNRGIFLIPAIFLLWVNCHGGVIAGLGILAVVVMIHWFHAMRNKLDNWKPLIIVFAGSCLIVLINPYGTELWAFFIESLTLPRRINEWGPIHFLDSSHLPFKILTVVFFITLFGNKKKQLWEVGIITISIIFAYKNQRHTVLAAIIAAPYLTGYIATTSKNLLIKENLEAFSASFKKITQTALYLFIAFQAGLTIHSYYKNNFQVIVEPTVYPTYLAQFLEDNSINGNIVAPFDWGEYLIWKRPNSKVAIDGRFRTVYPEIIIDQAWNFWERKENWKEILKKSDVVILKTKQSGDRGFKDLLEWKKVYQDIICVVYLKQNELNKRVISQFANKKLINRNTLPPYYFPG